MAKIVVAKATLAAAVASPAGTVAIGYPAGSVQADFTGVKASPNAYLLLNDNDRFTEVADQFDISYGASTFTITNKTGFSWPIGTELTIGLAAADASTYKGPVAAAITNPTGGTTIDAEGRTAINAILAALRAAGIVAP